MESQMSRASVSITRIVTEIERRFKMGWTRETHRKIKNACTFLFERSQDKTPQGVDGRRILNFDF
jgi:hypothetical protein